MKCLSNLILATLALLFFACGSEAGRVATEFCLEGELDLGARYQGLSPEAGERYPTTWCVVTEDDSGRILFSATGKSNPDMDGDWTIAYLPPDTVRIVNRDEPPDVQFNGVENFLGATRIRRLDPRRLLQSYRAGDVDDLKVEVADDRVIAARATADFPLRGSVAVEWQWDWTNPQHPEASLIVDSDLVFSATGRWRTLPRKEVEALFAITAGADPIDVPGDRWPSRVNLQLINVADGIHLVRGVRTGFQHLVVETDAGLVVADAPAGWLELHHVPPSDMVPGLGVSGLSENFVDFLAAEFDGRPITAVALTHLHDDHAGGARAFAAAGAEVYAPAEIAGFLDRAFNRSTMPADRLSTMGGDVSVHPLIETVTIGSDGVRARFLSLPSGPHSDAMLAVLATNAINKNYLFVSDIHVPRSEDDTPAVERAETECWFASWAVSALPDGTEVINSHSAAITPLSRLRAYLDSEICKSLAR